MKHAIFIENVFGIYFLQQNESGVWRTSWKTKLVF